MSSLLTVKPLRSEITFPPHAEKQGLSLFSQLMYLADMSSLLDLRYRW